MVDIYNHAVANTVATFDFDQWDGARGREWFAKFGPDNPLLAACAEDGAVAGYAYWYHWRPRPGYNTTRELSVYVSPAHHGKGVGTRLYAELFRRGHEAGLHTFVAVISGTNPASEALHRRFGFRPVGTLKDAGKKFGEWVDTAIWQAML